MGGDLNLDFMKPKNWMRGMRMKDLKHQYGLFPLFIAIGGGAVFGTAYLINLCLKGPDVSWRHAVNPQPFSKCPPTLQYKFLSFIDYSKLKRPKEQPEL